MDWQKRIGGGGGTFYTGPGNYGSYISTFMPPSAGFDTVCVCNVPNPDPSPPPYKCGSNTIDWGHLPIPRGGFLYSDILAHKRTGRCFCVQGYFDPGVQTWPPALMVAQMAGPHVDHPTLGRYPENAVIDHSMAGIGYAYRLWPGSNQGVGNAVTGDLVEIYWNESADPQPPRAGRPGGDIPAGYWRSYKSADGGATWVVGYSGGALWFTPETVGMYLGSITDNATHTGLSVFGSFEFWIYDDAYPEISIITPFDGQHPVNPAAWVEFDVMDGDYPLVDALTTVTINGVTAWASDAPAAGFSGSRTAITGGNHFIIYRPWLDAEEVIVAAHVEDTLGHADDETWDFAALAVLPTCVWGGGQYGLPEPPYGLCEPEVVAAVTPEVVDRLGGTEIEIDGSFVRGELYSVTLGGAPCYSGRQGYGYLCPAVSSSKLLAVTPPSTIGDQTVRVVSQAGGVQEGAVVVVEPSYSAKQLSSRACHPPWVVAGPRRIEEN